ncbi:MAG: shikimate kinase [Nonlabens sp.]|uniref:shikimate kinase n=1 Tax=Nonlabens sp. TaxID=1888209 RepID=UPI003EF2A03E
MLVFLGYMGSGKSVVGQRVSELLDYDFIDLDRYIEKEEKRNISKIFSENGAIYFRKKENQYLKTVIESEDKVILSLGGGTPCYYNHMEILNSHKNIKTFYLNAGIQTLTERLWDGRNTRPIITDIKTKEDLLEFIGKHLFERRPYYQQARHHIKVDDRNIDEIAQEVIGYLF